MDDDGITSVAPVADRPLTQGRRTCPDGVVEFPAALPHGPITTVVDGVYLVRGTFQMGPGMRIGRTMTIVALSDGLAILNAVRLDASGERELERLGTVKHLVKLSDSHGVDEPYYVDRYEPEVWTLPDAKAGRVTATQALGPAVPIPGARLLRYPGTRGWHESALLLPHGEGTLVSCDALQNHADFDGANFVGRIMTPLLGFKGGVIVPPMWRKAQKVPPEGVRAAMAEVSACTFQNLITGHGPAVVGGAGELVRAAIEAAAS